LIITNPYLNEDGKPTEILLFTLEYYGITVEQLKRMSEQRVRQMVKRFADVLNDGNITKSSKGSRWNNSMFVSDKESGLEIGYNDSGSFSRYFDLDKWFESRVKDLPKEVQKVFPFLIVPKASKSERNLGLDVRTPIKVNDGRQTEIDNPFQRGETPRRNIHPTVKPIQLGSYLVTLGSRPKDIVLDPFCGSGSFLISARLMGRHFIGCEINREYHSIAEARLKAWCNSPMLDSFS
jgi:site-specific DNA-methyltransferase (adenine-specific)